MQFTTWFLNQLIATLSLHAVDAFNGVLDGAKVHLFTNRPGMSPLTAVGDLTAPTYDTYAASSAIVWGAAVNLPGGGAQKVGDAKTFVASDGVVTDSITGYAITDGGGTNLIAYAMFDEPVAILKTGDGVVVVPSVALTLQGFSDGSPVV